MACRQSEKRDKRTKEKVLYCVVRMGQEKTGLYVNLSIRRKKPLNVTNTYKSEEEKKIFDKTNETY